jgi:hypothetical protein
MSVSVQNMAGDIINIDIFDRYRIFQLKNELCERGFVKDLTTDLSEFKTDEYGNIHDVYIEDCTYLSKEKKDKKEKSRIVLFLNGEEAENEYFVKEGCHYYLFIKDKSVKESYRALVFKKDSHGGLFLFYEYNNRKEINQYNIKVYNNWNKWESEWEWNYKSQVTYNDNLLVKINKKGYRKMRGELCDFKVNSPHDYDMSIEEINNFKDYYYERLTDEEVLNNFVNIFIGKFKNIVIVDNLDSYIKKT